LVLYIDKHSLTSSNDKTAIQLDLLLATNFNKKQGDVISKRDLNERFFAKLQNYYGISRDGTMEIKKGSPKPIQISVENRQGRKFVTKLNGLEDYAISPEELAQELKIMCAASTSVSQLPGKSSSKEVLVQGNFVGEICDMLIKKYQVSRKFIETKDLTKEAKKK